MLKNNQFEARFPRAILRKSRCWLRILESQNPFQIPQRIFSGKNGGFRKPYEIWRGASGMEVSLPVASKLSGAIL